MTLRTSQVADEQCGFRLALTSLNRILRAQVESRAKPPVHKHKSYSPTDQKDEDSPRRGLPEPGY